MAYREPGVYLEVQNNPRGGLVPVTSMIPLIMGTGASELKKTISVVKSPATEGGGGETPSIVSIGSVDNEVQIDDGNFMFKFEERSGISQAIVNGDNVISFEGHETDTFTLTNLMESIASVVEPGSSYNLSVQPQLDLPGNYTEATFTNPDGSTGLLIIEKDANYPSELTIMTQGTTVIREGATFTIQSGASPEYVASVYGRIQPSTRKGLSGAPIFEGFQVFPVAEGLSWVDPQVPSESRYSMAYGDQLLLQNGNSLGTVVSTFIEYRQGGMEIPGFIGGHWDCLRSDDEIWFKASNGGVPRAFMDIEIGMNIAVGGLDGGAVTYIVDLYIDVDDKMMIRVAGGSFTVGSQYSVDLESMIPMAVTPTLPASLYGEAMMQQEGAVSCGFVWTDANGNITKILNETQCQSSMTLIAGSTFSIEGVEYTVVTMPTVSSTQGFVVIDNWSGDFVPVATPLYKSAGGTSQEVPYSVTAVNGSLLRLCYFEPASANNANGYVLQPGTVFGTLGGSIQPGTGSNQDALPFDLVTGIVKIGKSRASKGDWGVGSDYTFVAPNIIKWEDGKGPVDGSTYYVTLFHAVEEKQFELKLMSSIGEVINFYGPDVKENEEMPTTCPISAGAQIALAQGAPLVYTLQVPVSDVEVSASDYQTALDTWAKFAPSIWRIVAMDTAFGVSAVVTGHVNAMSTVEERMERCSFLSRVYSSSDVPPTDFEGVLNKVGGFAEGIQNKRMSVIYPDFADRVMSNGSTKTLGAPYLLAALAGLQSKLPVARSLTRASFSGFTTLRGVKMVRTEKNKLAEKGVMILEQAAIDGPISIRHQLSTDMASTQSRENSILSIQDYCSKFLRTACEVYIGKYNINPELISMMKSTLTSALAVLKSNGIINDSRIDTVEQDEANPDTVIVSLSVLPPYPCNYIEITLVLE